jgi:hypothetical protein
MLAMIGVKLKLHPLTKTSFQNDEEFCAQSRAQRKRQCFDDKVDETFEKVETYEIMTSELAFSHPLCCMMAVRSRPHSPL